MSEVKKIYADDPLVKFDRTRVGAEATKHQIDGLLAEYEVQDIWWHWNKHLIEAKEPGEIYVRFSIEETVGGLRLRVGIRVDCPVIWDREMKRGRPPRPEQVNWDVSMRTMYYFIQTHLNSAYAMQSSKVVAFLGYVQGANGKQLKDLLLPELTQCKALIDESGPIVTDAEYSERTGG